MTSHQLPSPVTGTELYLAAVLGELRLIRDRLPERVEVVPDVPDPNRLVRLELVEPAVPVEVAGQGLLLEPAPAPVAPQRRARTRQGRPTP